MSIHDKTVTKIVCESNSVEFYFADGFDRVDGDTSSTISKGKIKFESCTPNDFFCYIIQRHPSAFGERFRGREISIYKLSRMLKEGKASIQIYVELYDYNRIYWRGELHFTKPNRFRRLPTVVVIDSMDFFPMVYSWE